MLAGDNEASVSNSAKIFESEQVRQFYDPNKVAGKIIAESIGANNMIAWDTYLFYDKGTEWKEHPPTPLDWAHQLDDLWADPLHFAWGKDLVVRLQEIMNSLIEN